jgi:hypothetical protein
MKGDRSMLPLEFLGGDALKAGRHSLLVSSKRIPALSERCGLLVRGTRQARFSRQVGFGEKGSNQSKDQC